MGFPDESIGVLDMQKIVDHRVALAPRTEPCAIGHEISNLRNDIRNDFSFGLYLKSFDQVRFDIEGVHAARCMPGCRECECPIPASEFGDTVHTAFFPEELPDHAFSIKETVPVLLVGHPALTALHHSLPFIRSMSGAQCHVMRTRFADPHSAPAHHFTHIFIERMIMSGFEL